MEENIVLATFSADILQDISSYQLRDVLAHISPDIVITELSSDTVRIEREVLGTDVLSLEKIKNRPNRVYCSHDTGIQLVCVGSHYDLQNVKQMEGKGEIDTSAETYIVSPLLDIEVDLIDLDVNLDGSRKYLTSLYGGGLEGTYTHLTTEAPPPYRNVWDNGLKVNGAMSRGDENEYNDTHGVGVCKLYSDGVIDSSIMGSNMFGLESLNQIGPKKAITLRDNGYQTINHIADLSVAQLSEMTGFGPTNSVDVLYSARSQVNDEIYARSKKYLPDESYDPVFINIQTDGIKSTMVWLIGVYDTWTGSYTTFTSKDPSEPGSAISSFLQWVDSNCPNRPIVAYNGMENHFPIIHHHATKYASKYVDMWDDAWQFDPLWWGPGRDNAMFPGRTNEPHDVITSLGWDYEYNLTNEVIGKRFEKWERYRTSNLEPNWGKYEDHSHDVVLSVKYLYDQLFDAEFIRTGSDSTSKNKAEETNESTLSSK